MQKLHQRHRLLQAEYPSQDQSRLLIRRGPRLLLQKLVTLKPPLLFVVRTLLCWPGLVQIKLSSQRQPQV